MKKVLLLGIGLIMMVKTFSQSHRETFNRYSFWSETVFNGVIKDKWKYQLDYQFRTSSEPSNVSESNKNPFQNHAQDVYRPWIHYQMNQNVRFSLSPLGFWETYYSNVEGNGVAKIQPEFRISPQIMLSNKIGKVSVDQRYRLEYRMMGQKVNHNGGLDYNTGMTFDETGRKYRGRYSLRFTIPLTQKLYVVTWNEIFISFGKNVSDNKIWDQNRTFCLIGIRPEMKIPMRFELGYGLQCANRYTSTVDYIEKNNILQMYVIFDNFNKIFKK